MEGKNYGENFMGKHNREGKISNRRSLIKPHKSDWNSSVVVGIVEVDAGGDR